MTRCVLRRTWIARLVLLAALVAFLAPALAGPFGSVCVCAGETPVAVGACCCNEHVPADAPPSDPCASEDCTCVDLVAADDPLVQGTEPPDPTDALAVDLVPADLRAPTAVLLAGTVRPAYAVRPPPDVGRAAARTNVLRI